MSLSSLLLISEMERASQPMFPSIKEHLCNNPTSRMYMCIYVLVTEWGGVKAGAEGHFHECQDSLWRLRGEISSLCHAHRRIELLQWDYTGWTQGHQRNTQHTLRHMWVFVHGWILSSVLPEFKKITLIKEYLPKSTKLAWGLCLLLSNTYLTLA